MQGGNAKAGGKTNRDENQSLHNLTNVCKLENKAYKVTHQTGNNSEFWDFCKILESSLVAANRGYVNYRMSVGGRDFVTHGWRRNELLA